MQNTQLAPRAAGSRPSCRRIALPAFTLLGGLLACRSIRDVARTEPPLEASALAGEISARAPTILPDIQIQALGIGRFSIVSSSDVELSSKAQIERLNEHGRWIELSSLDDGEGFRLHERCSAAPAPSPLGEAESCVKLHAGVPLKPAQWTGFSCASQCRSSCPDDRVQGGTHRLVLSSCSKAGFKVTSPQFVIPDSKEDLLRWRLSEDVVSASAVRLARALPGMKQIVRGYRTVGGTERKLSQDQIESVSKILRMPDYSPEIPRCVPHGVMGIRLEHGERPDPQSDAATLTLVVEFGCNLLWIPEHDSLEWLGFEAQRSFFELARSLYPTDPEFRKKT